MESCASAPFFGLLELDIVTLKGALVIQIVEREDSLASPVHNILVDECDQLSILFARIESIPASQVRNLGYLFPARAAGGICCTKVSLCTPP